ncbi:MAG: hypothetical protein ACN4G0_02955 [Polyangiales bacterium]
MFVGHYGPSFGLRRASGGVPLWVLFLAVQFVDVLWASLVIAGVEKVRLTPGFSASSPLDLYYMPYTHSLAASITWSVLLGVLAAFVWNRRGGIVVALCVISHWLLDLPVHLADLPLWGDVHKVGFGLWDRPLIAFILEAGVLFIGVALYAKHARSKVAIWIFGIAMLALQMTSLVMPPPETTTQFALMALSSYLFLAGAAWCVERRWGQVAGD